MGDAPASWATSPGSQVRYYYDERFDQIMYEDGRAIRRPVGYQREQLLAATSPNVSGQYGFQRQMPVANRYDNQGRMNAPRTLSHEMSAYNSGQNVPAPNTYPVTPVTPQQANNHMHRPSLSTDQAYWPQNQGSGSAVQAYPTPTSPGDLAMLMNFTSISSPASRDFHPAVIWTPQLPQMNHTQVYATPGSMPMSPPRSPEWVPEKEQKELYASFKRKEKTKKFFVIGKVFLTLWNEPAGDQGSNATAITDSISFGPFGERIHSKIRRFVVVREGEFSCTALPILTYGRQGVGKARVKKSEHAVIYTGKDPPEPLRSERNRRDEDPLLPPIRVDPDDLGERLDPLSRVDFGKVYNIEHNVKVRSYGKVHAQFMTRLLYQFRTVWSNTLKETGSQVTIKTSKGVQLETVEATDSARPADLMRAYNTLLANGYSTKEARSVLRSGFQAPTAGGPSNLGAKNSRDGPEGQDEDHGQDSRQDDDDDDDDHDDN